MADTYYLKDNLAGFVPTERATEIIKDVVRGSSLLRLCKVEQMSGDTKKIPVLTDGPGAYWVGESERIQTSKATWIFPELTAKKLAVIVPCTKEKLADTTIDVFSELQPYIAEAFHTSFDAAGLFGTNSPFATNIYDKAEANSCIVTGTDTSKFDIDASDAMEKVEAAGVDVDGWAAHYGVKNTIRKLRDSNNNALYVPGVDGGQFYNVPIEFVRNSGWDKDKAQMICGAWKYALVGIREGIEYEILREATLHSVTMADGKPLSLAENDMIAIKATMRLGFLVVKDKAFAVLAPASAVLGSLTVASAAGTTSGDTAITVTEALGSGNSYVYKIGTAATAVKYDRMCKTGWTEWNGESDITAATGKVITIVEITADKEARKAGHATVTAKA